MPRLLPASNLAGECGEEFFDVFTRVVTVDRNANPVRVVHDPDFSYSNTAGKTARLGC